MSADGTERWDDDDLEREEGVFVRRSGGTIEGCDDETDQCAPDDTVEDPIEDRHVPGTPDDLPYDYGVETPPPADQTLDTIADEGLPGRGMGVGHTGAPSDREPPDLGGPEQRELWDKQEPLIELSEREEQHYRTLTPEQAELAHEALAEDAEEPLAEAPGGTSATGESSEAD